MTAAPMPADTGKSLRHAFEDLAPDVSELQGRRSGIVSRGVAFAVDFGVVLAGYPILVWIYGALLALLNFSTPEYPVLPDWAQVIIPATWNWLYFTGCWAVAGRTIGMTLMGLKVVARRRQRVGIVRANIRFFVLFATLFVVGPVWLALSKSRLAIHDRVAHTQVIYDSSSRQRQLVVENEAAVGSGASTE